MSFLDLFALLILVVLATVAVGTYVMLAVLPGRIARNRHHPRADAVNVCAWCGFFTAGLLLPIAWIWAFADGSSDADSRSQVSATGTPFDEQGDSQ